MKGEVAHYLVFSVLFPLFSSVPLSKYFEATDDIRSAVSLRNS